MSFKLKILMRVFKLIVYNDSFRVLVYCVFDYSIFSCNSVCWLLFVRISNREKSVCPCKFGPGITHPVSERAAEYWFYLCILKSTFKLTCHKKIFLNFGHYCATHTFSKQAVSRFTGSKYFKSTSDRYLRILHTVPMTGKKSRTLEPLAFDE